nr:immunoglobulin light chain junction region [Macaca mulatta]
CSAWDSGLSTLC